MHSIFYFAVVCIIGVMLFSCLACQRSCCHYKKLCKNRLRKRSAQGLLESSEASSLDHLSAMSSNSSSFNSKSNSSRKSRKVGDVTNVLPVSSNEPVLNLNASLNNSWISGSGKGFDESFKKSRLLRTASKLGRKLIAMDKESEVKEASRRGHGESKGAKKPLDEEKNQWKKF